MKFNEFVILAKSIKTCYPKEKLLETEESMEIWYSMLKDLEYKPTSLAVQKYMMINKFPPTIADIREWYVNIVCGKPMSESEAWARVIDALKLVKMEGSARKKYDALPRAVRDGIGGYSQFLEWAENPSFNKEYAKANFFKAYLDAVKRDSVEARLNPHKWIEEQGKAAIEEK